MTEDEWPDPDNYGITGNPRQVTPHHLPRSESIAQAELDAANKGHATALAGGRLDMMVHQGHLAEYWRAVLDELWATP